MNLLKKIFEGQILILAWAGLSSDEVDKAFPILKDAGVDCYLAHCSDLKDALHYLDAGQENGLAVIPGFPELKDSTAGAVDELKDHPALAAYNIKDEPELSDFIWMSRVVDCISGSDTLHPSYINLYPDWAWGNDSYESHLNSFADAVDLPFYSFDQYPVRQVDASGEAFDGDPSEGFISVRETWYRNLEVMARVAQQRNKPFWAFALATSHHLGAPSPAAFYPVPTMGQLRLQVFSNLLYGAQAIQYFTADGIFDSETGKRSAQFQFIHRMNREIRKYDEVFAGCKVKAIRHIGTDLPQGTGLFGEMPEEIMDSIVWRPSADGRTNPSCHGLLVSYLENDGREYLAVQNKDCENPAEADIFFKTGKTVFSSGKRKIRHWRKQLAPGNIIVFQL